MTTDLPQNVDLLIVGAGVVGLAHAARALNAGLSVLVIDRDHHNTGASVRNFGHIGSTLQSGELGELSRASREIWLELGQRGALAVKQTGTVVIAENELELGVLEDLASKNPHEVSMKTPSEIESLTSIRSRAGAFFPLDLRVNPREAVPSLATWLDAQERCTVLWVTSYLGRDDDGTVRTSRGKVKAERVIIAVGHDLDTLEPDTASEHKIERCRLNMTRVDAGLPAIGPALLTATSMIRYSAFHEAASFNEFASDARARLSELVGIEANLMMTQLPDGTLIVGDSHHVSPGAPPFLDESVTQTLLGAASGLLGRELRVVERWQGVYASSSVAPFLVREIEPSVTAVSVTTGLGMTISHGLAAKAAL